MHPLICSLCLLICFFWEFCINGTLHLYNPILSKTLLGCSYKSSCSGNVYNTYGGALQGPFKNTPQGRDEEEPLFSLQPSWVNLPLNEARHTEIFRAIPYVVSK